MWLCKRCGRKEDTKTHVRNTEDDDQVDEFSRTASAAPTEVEKDKKIRKSLKEDKHRQAMTKKAVNQVQKDLVRHKISFYMQENTVDKDLNACYSAELLEWDRIKYLKAVKHEIKKQIRF